VDNLERPGRNGPILAFMSSDPTKDLSLDVNGCLTERITRDGIEVIIHYDDIPESDITQIDGLRCTTALRTVIDLAAGLKRTELEQMVRDCLDRRLFTRLEAVHRVSEPDMLTRHGATLVGQVVRTLGAGA
jgi:hypothetical protein